MVKIVKKHPLSLLEVFISLGLFSIILLAIFTSFRQISFVSSKNDRSRKEVLERVGFHEVISRLISTAEPTSFSLLETETGKSAILEFSFDNGRDDEDAFSGNLTTRIYLSNKGHVVIETDAFNGAAESRREEYFTDVEKLTFNLDFSPAVEMNIAKADGGELSFVFIRSRAMQEPFGSSEIEQEGDT